MLYWFAACWPFSASSGKFVAVHEVMKCAGMVAMLLQHLLEIRAAFLMPRVYVLSAGRP